MFYQGFIKVAAASPSVKVGDAMHNIKQIVAQLKEAQSHGAQIVVFPELTVCGYSVGDLIYQEYLYRDNLEALTYLLENNPLTGVVIVGTFVIFNDRIYNTAIVIQKDKILGIVPKWFLPHTHEFSENRWYTSGYSQETVEVKLLGQKVPFGQMIFSDEDGVAKFGVEVCQDLWSPLSPNETLYANGAVMVFNCSASPESVTKGDIRTTIVKSLSYRNNGAYIYTSNNVSESTSEVIFSNHKMIYSYGEKIAEVNEIKFENNIVYGDLDLCHLHHSRKSSSWMKNVKGKFEELPEVTYDLEETKSFAFEKPFDPLPFVPRELSQFRRIIDMQAASMFKRLDYVGTQKTVIGVSGGLDSTLALLSLVHMCDVYKIDRSNIIALTLPSSNTSSKSYEIALALMKKLKVDFKSITIEEDVKRQLKEIGHDGVTKDVTYENVQARFRTYTLMNIANLNKAIVVGTGDMSEVALGWSTFNGDQMAMYALNSGLPKTVVKATVNYYKSVFPEVADELVSVLEAPISPELTGGNQKTEDMLGKFEINDFILYRFLVCGDSEERIDYLLHESLGLSKEEANKYSTNFMKRFFSNQYKRLTMPEGVKILDLSLSPRGQLRLNGDMYKPNK